MSHAEPSPLAAPSGAGPAGEPAAKPKNPSPGRRPPPKLSTREICAMRGEGHHLSPVVLIGKEGITPGLLAATDEALDSHGLIKIRVSENAPSGRHEAAAELAKQAGAALVQVIGRTALLYRVPPPKPAGAKAKTAATDRARDRDRDRDTARPGKPGPRAGAAGRPARSADAERAPKRAPARGDSGASGRSERGRPAERSPSRSLDRSGDRPGDRSGGRSGDRPGRPSSPSRGSGRPRPTSGR